MLNRIDKPQSHAADRRVREQPIIHIDPDFYVPAGGERGNSYLRAMRILFPKAS